MGRLLVLGAMICGTLLITYATDIFFWKHSDYVMRTGRALLKPPIPPRDLRDLCAEECWVRALLVFLVCAAACLWYAYFQVFEQGQARRLWVNVRLFFER